MKKTTFCCMVTLFALLTLCNVSHAAGTSAFTLSGPTSGVKAGESFSVAVKARISGTASPVSLMGTVVTYDPSQVECTGQTVEGLFGAAPLNVKAIAGRKDGARESYIIEGFSLNEGLSLTADTDYLYATLNFKVKSGAAAGDSIVINQEHSLEPKPGVTFKDKRATVSTVNAISVSVTGGGGGETSSAFTLSGPTSGVKVGESFSVAVKARISGTASPISLMGTVVTYDPSQVECTGQTVEGLFSAAPLNVKAIAGRKDGARESYIIEGFSLNDGLSLTADTDYLYATLNFKVKSGVSAGDSIEINQEHSLEPKPGVTFKDKRATVSTVNALNIPVTGASDSIIVKTGETVAITTDKTISYLEIQKNGTLIIDGATLTVDGEINDTEIGKSIILKNGGQIIVKNAKVKNIDILTSGDKYILAGEEKDLWADITPFYAVNRDIQWNSSNHSVATVDANGHVTAKLPESRRAEVTITASALDGSGASGSMRLMVLRPAVESISIQPSIKMDKGEIKDLYAILSVSPAMALKPERAEFTWTSDNADITVDESGVVSMPNKDCEARIMITYKTDSAIKATCQVYTSGVKSDVLLKLQTKLEGRPSGGASGKPEANIEKMALEIYDVSNALLWSGAASADTSGVAEYVIENGVLNDGDAVQLWIKGERYLAVLESHVVAVTNGMWNVEMIAIARGGDADDSNRVAIGDFNILSPAFNWPIGQPKYNRLADFDNSGRVAIGDFNILSRHFNYPGDRRPKTSVTLNLIAANRNGTLGEALGLSDGGANASADTASGGCSAGWALLSLLGAVPFAVKKISRKRLR